MNIENLIRRMSNENTAQTLEYNAHEAAKARDFQYDMSNTSHQREVQDLKAAGLNPALSANSGAQSYSAASASGAADGSAIGALAGLYQTKMNNQNAKEVARINQQTQKATNKAQIKAASISAAASRYASDNASSASRYAADHSYNASLYGSDRSYAASTYGTDRSKFGLIDNFLNGILNGNSKERSSSSSTAASKLGNLTLKYFKKANSWRFRH